MSEHFKKKNIILVGDSLCGKTTLLFSYLKKCFLPNYIPTAFDIYEHKYDDEYEFEFRDTGGQTDYDRLRPLVYPGADLILMCFSINSLESLDNVVKKWFREVKIYCVNTPCILVGTKMDLMRQVSLKDAQFAMKKINALIYKECSAKSNENIDRLFECVINEVIQKPKKRKNLCFLS